MNLIIYLATFLLGIYFLVYVKTEKQKNKDYSSGDMILKIFGYFFFAVGSIMLLDSILL